MLINRKIRYKRIRIWWITIKTLEFKVQKLYIIELAKQFAFCIVHILNNGRSLLASLKIVRNIRSFNFLPLAVIFEDSWSPLQTIWIQMRPHKMWGLIWYPNCLTFILYISKYIGFNHWIWAFLGRKKKRKDYWACKL